MKLTFSPVKKPFAAVQFIMIAVWAANLAHTQSYFVSYALCALVAVVCLCDNYRRNWKLPLGARILAVLTAGLFGLAVPLANYDLFEIIRNPAEVSLAAISPRRMFCAVPTTACLSARSAGLPGRSPG